MKNLLVTSLCLMCCLIIPETAQAQQRTFPGNFYNYAIVPYDFKKNDGFALIRHPDDWKPYVSYASSSADTLQVIRIIDSCGKPWSHPQVFLREFDVAKGLFDATPLSPSLITSFDSVSIIRSEWPRKQIITFGVFGRPLGEDLQISTRIVSVKESIVHFWLILIMLKVLIFCVLLYTVYAPRKSWRDFASSLELWFIFFLIIDFIVSIVHSNDTHDIIGEFVGIGLLAFNAIMLFILHKWKKRMRVKPTTARPMRNHRIPYDFHDDDDN